MEETNKSQEHQTYNKKSKKKRTKKAKTEETISEPSKPSRSATPPSKNVDSDAWHTWYKEEIKELISKGVSLDDISKKLNIRRDSVENFIN